MEVATPFDIMAETYDQDFTLSRIGQLQRSHVWDALNPLLSHKMGALKILEINCGTGEDAIHFAKLGHQVMATDLSATMIAKAGNKIAQIGFDDMSPRLLQCGFNELYGQLGQERFDLVFSNFGGINCIDEPAIRQLSKDCSNMLKPGGQFVIVAMNSFCLWESAYYLYKMKFNQAFRRLGKNHQLQIGESSLRFFPYSPRRLKNLVGDEFKLDSIFPIGLAIPPSYLERQFSSKQRWLLSLNRWEMKLRKWSILSLLSDHFLVILKKRAK